MSAPQSPASVFTTGLSVAAGTPLVGKSGIDGRTHWYALAAITRHSALYAVRFVGRAHAMDVAQVVTIRVDAQLRADPSFPDKSTPLIGVVRELTEKEAQSFRKKNARRRRPEGVHATERAESVAIQLDPESRVYEADMRMVREMIDERISRDASAAFSLSRDDGLTIQQVADAQHTTRSRAKKRIGKALHASRIICDQLDIPAPPPLGKTGFLFPEPRRSEKKKTSLRRSHPDHPASGGPR